MSWTLYGLVTSQFGDIKERIDTGETVEEFVRSYFGYRDDFVGVAAAVLVGFTLLFGFTSPVFCLFKLKHLRRVFCCNECKVFFFEN